MMMQSEKYFLWRYEDAEEEVASNLMISNEQIQISLSLSLALSPFPIVTINLCVHDILRSSVGRSELVNHFYFTRTSSDWSGSFISFLFAFLLKQLFLFEFRPPFTVNNERGGEDEEVEAELVVQMISPHR